MKKVFLLMLFMTALVQLSSCSKKSTDSDTTTTTSYGDLPSQLATGAY
ncbi:MAG: hypothetical protein J0M15_04115 [Deltaproteobacteria bacterium]|nr:hypothetical protein [Deltaproteobacteria bacterium]